MKLDQRLSRRRTSACAIASFLAGAWLMVAHTSANDGGGGGLGDPPGVGMKCPTPCDWIQCGVSNNCRCEGRDSCIVISTRPVRVPTQGISSQPRIVL